MAKIIGLTGPIGAGKDEAAKILRKHGVAVIDADAVAHTLYRHQSPVWGQIVRTFGSKILNRGGEINRRKLGEIVFSDKKWLDKLDWIVHPYLKDAIIELVEKRKPESHELIVINAAVLKEIGLINYVDEVWVVMASREKRFRRLIRAGMGRERAKVRMRSQMSRKKYLELADAVIQNDGTFRELSKKVAARL